MNLKQLFAAAVLASPLSGAQLAHYEPPQQVSYSIEREPELQRTLDNVVASGFLDEEFVPH